jgi:type IV pilus assembly protein PilW
MTMHRISPRLHASGFSLVELMVAMAVGLGLVAAVSVMFASTSQARTELAKTGRMFENGRYGLDLLAEELGLAGYFGEMPLVTVQTVVPDPCLTDPALLGWRAEAPTAIPAAIVGYSAGAAMPGCLDNQKAGTDAVVVRRVATTSTAANALVSGTPYLQTSRCQDDLPTFAVGASAAQLSLRSIDCAQAADARRLIVRIYYVSRCNDCARDTIPTLKRVDLQGGRLVVTPLVESIEDLRIDYGFDLNADGTADRYLRTLSGVASAADDDWANVVSARVNLLVRTAEMPAGHLDVATYQMGASGRQGPFSDGWKRTVFSSAVRLPNPAGRRE